MTDSTSHDGPAWQADGEQAAYRAGVQASDFRPDGPLSGIAAGWHAVTGWRRRRPFWGGLLLLIAGTELLMIPLPVHAMGLILHIGTGGVLGVLIGAILIVCGLLLWFNPAQRVFYAIVAVLLAVAALVASNLGGFLIGTLLGIIGGSLGFAWAPVQQGPPPPGRGRRRKPGREAGAAAGLSAVLGARRRRAASENDGGIIRGFALFPVLLVTVAGLTHLSPGAAARPDLCLPGLPPLPVLNSCPSPSPSPTGPAGSPSASGPGGKPSPSPSASASPSPTVSSSAGASQGTSPSPSPSPRAGTAPAFAVATEPSSLAASSAVITGFAYDGTVNVRTTSGTVRMMQFSMTSLSLTSIDLRTSQDGAVISTRAPSLDLSGDVVLYASKLSGDLLGVPISITPDSTVGAILAAIAPLTKTVPVRMTNVVTDQPFSSADRMTASGLTIS